VTFRDRFFTARTAKALASWRILVGIAVGVVLELVGLGLPAAILFGLVAYGALVYRAMPKSGPPPPDPFTLSEPWRHFMQDARRTRNALRDTVRAMRPGPLQSRVADIADRLDKAIQQTWSIARRGDDIDAAVKRIDPTRLRSRLETLRAEPGTASAEAIASVESQLQSADRLKALSADTADKLRVSQARLDELVARAAEVSIGTGDTDTYAHDVDDLALELEGLRQAVAETNRPEIGPP
jgi:succinate dehydrogenase/fumarate reductase flavoprotein subunit